MNIDSNTQVFLGNTEIVEIRKGNVTIWEKSSTPAEVDYFYIENTYDGINTIFLKKISVKVAQLPEGSYTTSVEYSKDKENWTTFNITTTSEDQYIQLNQGDKVYFRNSNGNWSYMSGSNRRTIYFNTSQSAKAGGNVNTLLDYNNPDTVSLKSGCFASLFRQAAQMTFDDLVLPAKTLSTKCYNEMFRSCTAMTTAPKLYATTLADNCYGSMFYGCTSLTTAPTLPATNLAGNCYYYMFRGCSKLNTVIAYTNTSSSSSNTRDWLYGTASKGTFYNFGTYNWPSGTSGIPSGWTVVNSGYFNIENTSGTTNTLTLTTTKTGNPSVDKYSDTIQYSKDKSTWTTLNLVSGTPATVEMSSGEKVYFKNESGKLNCYDGSNNSFITKISCSGAHTASGNIETIVDYLNPIDDTLTITGQLAELFRDDSTLTNASGLEIPYTNLSSSCYSSMFRSCSSLTTGPVLPATSVTASAYQFMFSNDTSLTTVPQMEAETVGNRGMYSMFSGCTTLTKVEIDATSIGNEAMRQMFYNCSNLAEVETHFTSTSATDCTLNWLYGVVATGTIYNDGKATLATGSASGVPSGWTLDSSNYIWFKNDYSSGTTLTFTNEMYDAHDDDPDIPALDPSKYASSVQYSSDRVNWNTLTINANDTETITVPANGKLWLKNNNGKWNFIDNEYGSSWVTKMTNSNYVSVGGDLYTLLDYTGTHISDREAGCFCNLFTENNYLKDASKLEIKQTNTVPFEFSSAFYFCSNLEKTPKELPATTLEQVCYSSMFYYCEKVTEVPELPATTLADECYNSMFYGTAIKEAPELPATTLAFGCYCQIFGDCKSLITPPALPAMTMEPSCYSNMFYGCTSLTTAPTLPATTLAENCYEGMFYGCTSLTTTPTLPATTLEQSCYQQMFDSCTHLTTVPNLTATNLATACYGNMFNGCTALVTAPSISAATLPEYSCNGMFQGCTHLTTVPDLTATTIYGQACLDMFNGCTALVTAPDLSATTLYQNACSSMFSGCTSLVNPPVLPATTLAQGCYASMFYGCTSLVNPPVLPATTLREYCYDNMFSGCTALTTIPNIPATTLAPWCCQAMFGDCTSLTSITLPNKTLAEGCYVAMFYGCTSLTTATLQPTTLEDYCYNTMFSGCTSLNNVTTYATDISAQDCLADWMEDVSATGDFYNLGGATYPTGTSGIPSGWTEHTSL